MIGIVGGMGPMAGVDLAAKLIEETTASTDRDHVPFVLWSEPNVPDRTAFLDETSSEDPRKTILESLDAVARLGVTVAVLACNTAHAPAIFDEIEAYARSLDIKMIHVVRETVTALKTIGLDSPRVGVLATIGAHQSRLYESEIESNGMEVVYLSEDLLHAVHHAAIYDPKHGLKGQTDPPSDVAANIVLEAIRELRADHADVVVLGCTELPLLYRNRLFTSEVEAMAVRLVDPTRVAARALIASFAPEKLRESA